MYIRNNYNHMIEEGKNPWDLLQKYLLVTKYTYDNIRPESQRMLLKANVPRAHESI